MTLGELVKELGGKLAQGRPETAVTGVNAQEHATAGDLVFAEDAGAGERSLSSAAGCVVLRAGCLASYESNAEIAVVEAEQPRLWFARAARLLAKAEPSTGVHASAVVGAGVVLGATVSIGPCAVIGDGARIGAGTRIDAGAVVGEGVAMGEGCRIHPRAVLYAGVTLGNRVVVHAGAVLGADGFGYVRDAKTGAYTQFPQRGTLFVEDDVEIGANSTIDRGALELTRIRRGTKIDNLVHVGHNCDIGEDVILVALAGISGSSTVGNGTVIAGQVGIGDHVHIGPGMILGGQAGVFSGSKLTNEGMKPGTVLYGTPARPLRQVLREQAVLARLAKKRGRGD
jgi:UDP-3-O-[3-hydroxymyristoyl] glucosamine N-acyltransferase